jgi:hypothetical protein
MKFSWVRSVLIPESKRAGTNSSRFYNPKSSRAKAITGGRWSTVYGDGDAASGQVFLDSVATGNLVVPNQAVGATNVASTRCIRDRGKDGIIGFGFTRGNSFKPTKQPTWFDNIRSTLATPLFTASLNRLAPGSYDFGYIDKTKYKGEIVWTTVKPGSYWGLSPTGFAIGSGPTENFTIAGIADTGTSLMYLPARIVQKYWATVKGARTGLTGDWQFPCNANLPDISLVISNKAVTVRGINMKYLGQAVGGGYCHGGLQKELKNLRFSILGAVFHKSNFVVHEAPIKGQPRLGFAESR